METLNDFASWMEAGTKKHAQPLPRQPMAWPTSMILIAKKLHYTKFGDKVWLNGQNITTTCPMKKGLDHM